MGVVGLAEGFRACGWRAIADSPEARGDGNGCHRQSDYEDGNAGDHPGSDAALRLGRPILGLQLCQELPVLPALSALLCHRDFSD
jgi:hypothetical protein